MSKLPLKVGITGGIGSGKTHICKIFSELGIPVFNADQAAKDLMVSDAELRTKITKLLGDNAYNLDGTLNRAGVAESVFNHPALLKSLNELVHPVVIQAGDAWHKNQKSVPFTIKEAALLVESGSYKLLDYLIVVSAPEEIRLERVTKRDNTSREQVLARMKKQLPEKTLLQHADFEINNDETVPLIPQIHQVYRQLVEHL